MMEAPRRKRSSKNRSVTDVQPDLHLTNILQTPLCEPKNLTNRFSSFVQTKDCRKMLYWGSHLQRMSCSPIPNTCPKPQESSREAKVVTFKRQLMIVQNFKYNTHIGTIEAISNTHTGTIEAICNTRTYKSNGVDNLSNGVHLLHACNRKRKDESVCKGKVDMRF